MAVKKFADMTRAERRVAIAKDVIEWVTAEKLDVLRGCYFGGQRPDWLPERSSREFPKSVAQRIVNDCFVCALGSLFLVKVMNHGHVTSDVVTFNRGEPELSRLSIYEALEDCFSRWQLVDIEDAFEDGDEEDGDEEDRLLEIMQSIVDHKGIVCSEYF
jgi:hypothetical protein